MIIDVQEPQGQSCEQSYQGALWMLSPLDPLFVLWSRMWPVFLSLVMTWLVYTGQGMRKEKLKEGFGLAVR